MRSGGGPRRAAAGWAYGQIRDLRLRSHVEGDSALPTPDLEEEEKAPDA